MSQCAVSENIHTPTITGIEIAWGRKLGEGAVRTKNIKKSIYGVSRGVGGGEGVLRKTSFKGEVWIFSGTTT